MNFLNPAFFDVTKNQVACGSDLQRLCDELEKIREFHEKRLKELADEEKELKAAYKNKVPPDLLATIENERTRIKGAESATPRVISRSGAGCSGASTTRRFMPT